MSLKKNKLMLFVIILGALVSLIFVAINAGSLQVSVGELFQGLFIEYKEEVAIIYDLRFPRIIVSILSGASLAVAGVLFQAVLKNPLADPSIIGVSSGASVCAVIVASFFPAYYFTMPLFAFFGGMIAFFLVYSLSFQNGMSPIRILLVGIAVNAVLNGTLSAIDKFSGGNASATVASNITMKTWEDVKLLAIYVAIGLVLAFVSYYLCNLLALEDRTARSIGINITMVRILISIIAVLLTSIATAVVGVLSFVGLIVPHIARLLVGANHKYLLPFSALLGAFFVLLADTVGRTIMMPYEIEASIILAIVGGPFFILLLRRNKKI